MLEAITKPEKDFIEVRVSKKHGGRRENWAVEEHGLKERRQGRGTKTARGLWATLGTKQQQLSCLGGSRVMCYVRL